jgi:hypothetical protein
MFCDPHVINEFVGKNNTEIQIFPGLYYRVFTERKCLLSGANLTGVAITVEYDVLKAGIWILKPPSRKDKGRSTFTLKDCETLYRRGFWQKRDLSISITLDKDGKECPF